MAASNLSAGLELVDEAGKKDQRSGRATGRHGLVMG